MKQDRTPTSRRLLAARWLARLLGIVAALCLAALCAMIWDFSLGDQAAWSWSFSWPYVTVTSALTICALLAVVVGWRREPLAGLMLMGCAFVLSAMTAKAFSDADSMPYEGGAILGPLGIFMMLLIGAVLVPGLLFLACGSSTRPTPAAAPSADTQAGESEHTTNTPVRVQRDGATRPRRSRGEQRVAQWIVAVMLLTLVLTTVLPDLPVILGGCVVGGILLVVSYRLRRRDLTHEHTEGTYVNGSIRISGFRQWIRQNPVKWSVVFVVVVVTISIVLGLGPGDLSLLGAILELLGFAS